VIATIKDIRVLQVKPFEQFGTPVEIIEEFEGKNNYMEAL